jgi:hypothetical protein
VAKNKNRNQSQEPRDQRASTSAQEPEHAPSHMAKEPVMPQAVHSARKQQKKFGHN